ncbi:anthranilate phosphoribosyltransferase [Buchnera aphidicola]|uniref:anthranilate phosphoribosyltransferase n=1 Tax=Buchnera aphidicola TaxID=9 RepID=UPI0031B816C9
MKKILKKIYQCKNITKKESKKLFQYIINNKFNEIQLSAILIAMKIKEESSDEILGAVLSLKKTCKFFPKPKYLFYDIVGTGGKDLNIINISTATAFVLASAGIKIIKHCNYNMSSKYGSANILEMFNIPINISPNKSKYLLDKYNICFLLAQKYYSNFKSIKNIRKNINTRTIYNILGPLLNPAKPNSIVIGVYHKNLILPIITILKKLKYKNAIVINNNNIDEILLNGTNNVAELNNNIIKNYKLKSKDFGLKNYSKNKIKGGNINYNTKVIKHILKGTKKYIALENTVAANAAIFLRNLGFYNLKENTKYILNIINSGKAYQNLLSIANSW